jgi:hypothetical protein
VVIIALLLFLKLDCDGGKGSGSDTLSVKIDTVYVSVKKDTQYIPRIDKVIYSQNVPVPIHDTIEIFDFHNVDTAKILSGFFAKRVYSDTQYIEYGSVIINDTVTQNRISRRELIINQNVPTITKEIVLRQPKKAIAYVGFIAAGNEHTPVYGVGASFGVKFKNDKYLGASYILTQDGNPLYAVDFKFPIKIRK